MHALRRFRNLLILTSLTVGIGAQATSLTRADYSAHKTQIEADYKSDKMACDRLGGNDKDICVEKAKGKEKIAKAELDFNNSGSESDAQRLLVAKADSDYAVARERCDDRKGSDKEACVGHAKAVHAKALADAKMSRKVGAASPAAVTASTG